jgi:hypothetical protein
VTLFVQIVVVAGILIAGGAIVYAAFVPPLRASRRASENLERRGERVGVLERGGSR